MPIEILLLGGLVIFLIVQANAQATPSQTYIPSQAQPLPYDFGVNPADTASWDASTLPPVTDQTYSFSNDPTITGSFTNVSTDAFIAKPIKAGFDTSGVFPNTPWDGYFSDADNRYGLPANLTKSLSNVETGGTFNEFADAGDAYGLMQLKRSIYGADATDPQRSIYKAASIIAANFRSLKNLPDAVAAYHTGVRGLTANYGTLANAPAGLQNYVRAVLQPIGVASA